MKFSSKWYYNLLEKLILAIATIICVVPIYIIISNSFRRPLDVKKMPPELFFDATYSHYQKIIANDNFLLYFRNTLIISISATVITISLALLAAYGLKLFKSKAGVKLSSFLLIGKLVPTITVLIPLFTMFCRVGIVGTHWGPILAYCATTIPFITWLLSSFINDVPNELLEAATVMGCSRLKALPLVIMPLLKPAIASAVILTMQYSWNELLYALQLTNLSTYTLTVGVARYAGAVSVEWGRSSAAATITLVPIVLLGFSMQKYLVTGLTAGAVKG